VNAQTEATLPSHPPGGVGAWAAYAKERYDAGEKRLADFRNWARQLAAATGAVIGIEMAIGVQLFKASEHHAAWVTSLAAATWLLVVFEHVRLLRAAIKAGYIGQEHQGPESATVVADHLSDDAGTRRLLGAYYARGGDRIHVVAEAVVRDVSQLARRFIRSLDMLFVSFVLATVLTLMASR
jgi:hypothetical protein